MNAKLLFLILTAFLCTACTAPIDIQTNDSPPVLVIYGVLTDEFKSQEVMISRSSPYFAGAPNVGVSGAVVTVQSSENAHYSFVESDSVQGLYYSQNPFKVQSDIQYDLSVEVDFENKGVKEKYEASTTVLPAVGTDSLSFETISFFGRKNHMLYLHWQDNPEGNCYLFNVAYNDSLLTNKLSEFRLTDNNLFKGQYVKAGIYRFNDIANWETDSPENREHSIYLRPGDKVTVKAGLISKGYFDFIIQCQGEQKGENPMFGGPPSNIVSNISNGGVGYFTGYCTSPVHIELKENN